MCIVNSTNISIEKKFAKKVIGIILNNKIKKHLVSRICNN